MLVPVTDDTNTRDKIMEETDARTSDYLLQGERTQEKNKIRVPGAEVSTF